VLIAHGFVAFLVVLAAVAAARIAELWLPDG
jgi:hypothetical protein